MRTAVVQPAAARRRPQRGVLSAGRVVRDGVWIAAAVSAVQIPANLIDFGAYAYRYALVDPNNEQSLFAWIGAVAMIVGTAIALTAYRKLKSRRYLAVAVVLR